MVRLIVPVQFYLLGIVGKLVPLEIKQELRALVLLFNRRGVPRTVIVQTCRLMISEHGINMSRELGCEFDSKSDGHVISEISCNSYSI